MKRNFTWLIILGSIITTACEFNRSVNLDMMTGLMTKGNGLSCTNTYMTNSDGRIERTDFVYGEKIELHFNHMEGFVLKGKEAFPGMSLTIISTEGDTAFYSKDLYNDYQGKIDMSPLELTASFTVANPMHSKKSYRLFIHMWDKKGKGTFDAEMKFTVNSNPALKHKVSNVRYDEIYLLNAAKNTAITNDTIHTEDNIILFFEGLKGFKEVNGKCDVIVAMHLKDNKGNFIVDEPDLTQGEPIDAVTINERLATNFVIHPGIIHNPITVEVSVSERSNPTTSIRTIATLHVGN